MKKSNKLAKEFVLLTLDAMCDPRGIDPYRDALRTLAQKAAIAADAEEGRKDGWGDPPTKAGFYWATGLDGEAEPVLVEVFEDASGVLFYPDSVGNYVPVDEDESVGWWSAPLKAPRPPDEDAGW